MEIEVHVTPATDEAEDARQASPQEQLYEYLTAIPGIQGKGPGPAGLAQGIPAWPADRCSNGSEK